MVAAAALGDVVVEPGDVEQLRLGQILGDVGGDRKALRVGLVGQPAHVAHHLDGVGVDRIDVEQVVLHLADDAAEFRQVAAEDSVAGHALQLVGQIALAFEQAYEQVVVARIVSKAVVHPPLVGENVADRGGADTTQLGVLAEQDEDLQQRGGVALEQIRGNGLEIVVAKLKTLVEAQDSTAAAAVEDLLVEVLQQHVVEPAHREHGAVVALHELLDGEALRRVAIAELLGKGALVVEVQALLGATGDQMQSVAHPPEEFLGLAQLFEFLAGEQVAVGQRLQ